MWHAFRSLCGLVLVVLAPLVMVGQMQVDTTLTADELVDHVLTGRGIRVGNVRFKGDPRALGKYTCGTNTVGLSTGVLMSTGYSTGACGPNATPGRTGVLQMPKRNKGDRDLNRLTRGLRTTDHTVLEFDFIALHNKVEFEYVFGSDEYREYVGSKYNDVFGFFVSGPGLYKENVALVPGSIAPVAINNVNHKREEAYFVDNDAFVNVGLFKNVANRPRVSFWKRWKAKLSKEQVTVDGELLYYRRGGLASGLDPMLIQTFEYDGLTQRIRAEFHVVPYTVYHIKLAIGDVGDAAFDSGVFLQERSLTSYRDTSEAAFKDYEDQSATFDFDAAFRIRKAAADSAAVDTLNSEEQPGPFQLTTIHFDSGSYLIADSAYAQLDRLAEHLGKNPQYSLTLIGFTDNSGSDRQNKALSEKRAAAILYHLITRGVDSKRLNYVGRSSLDPIGDNRTEAGRRLNRRVELVLETE